MTLYFPLLPGTFEKKYAWITSSLFTNTTQGEFQEAEMKYSEGRAYPRLSLKSAKVSGYIFQHLKGQ